MFRQQHWQQQVRAYEKQKLGIPTYVIPVRRPLVDFLDHSGEKLEWSKEVCAKLPRGRLALSVISFENAYYFYIDIPPYFLSLLYLSLASSIIVQPFSSSSFLYPSSPS